MKKNLIFYFSTSGNSLYTAKEIAKHLKDAKIISIVDAFYKKEFKYEAETIGFVYPIYASGLPPMVSEFISKLQLNKDSYIFAAECTGGGKGITFSMINKLLYPKNLSLSNGEKFLLNSNYIRMGRNPKVGEDAKKVIDSNKFKIENFTLSILNRESKDLKEKHTRINLLLYKLWKDGFKNKDKNFNINEFCTACGICAKICPNENIEIVDEGPKWKGNCCDCMGCVNNCPHKCINIGNKTKKKNRYKNPYILTSELLRK